MIIEGVWINNKAAKPPMLIGATGTWSEVVMFQIKERDITSTTKFSGSYFTGQYHPNEGIWHASPGFPKDRKFADNQISKWMLIPGKQN